MNADCLTVLLILSYGSPVLAQTSPPATDNIAHAIHQLDSRRAQAMINADSAALAKILADDLTYAHTNGQVDTKAQLITAILSGRLKYEAINYDESQLRIYGPAAISTGLVTMQVKAGDRALRFQARFSSIYVKKDERWQLVAWQSTRLPE